MAASDTYTKQRIRFVELLNSSHGRQSSRSTDGITGIASITSSLADSRSDELASSSHGHLSPSSTERITGIASITSNDV